MHIQGLFSVIATADMAKARQALEAADLELGDEISGDLGIIEKSAIQTTTA